MPRRDLVKLSGAILGGVFLTALALASARLESTGVFKTAAWPITVMLWLFPGPCFDRGPDLEPFCEGTPVQMAAAFVGLLAMTGFYTALCWIGLRGVVRARTTSSLR